MWEEAVLWIVIVLFLAILFSSIISIRPKKIAASIRNIFRYSPPTAQDDRNFWTMIATMSILNEMGRHHDHMDR